MDIPDYDAIEDESFPPLPPPQSPGQGGQDDGDPFANGEKLHHSEEYSTFKIDYTQRRYGENTDITTYAHLQMLEPLFDRPAPNRPC